MCRPPVRHSCGPMGVHEVHGGGSGLPKAAEDSGVPVSRRLATGRSLRGGGAEPRRGGSAAILQSGDTGQCPQINPGSYTEGGIHRGGPGCGVGQGKPPGVLVPGHSADSGLPAPVPHHNGETLPPASGPRGSLHVRGPVHQAQAQDSAGLARTGILPRQRSSRLNGVSPQ
ncbi:hypothetical protein G0U57_020999, partial [Chelydra serpentina]